MARYTTRGVNRLMLRTHTWEIVVDNSSRMGVWSAFWALMFSPTPVYQPPDEERSLMPTMNLERNAALVSITFGEGLLSMGGHLTKGGIFPSVVLDWDPVRLTMNEIRVLHTGMIFEIVFTILYFWTTFPENYMFGYFWINDVQVLQGGSRWDDFK